MYPARKAIAALAFILAALPAAAESTMDAQAFENYTHGKTLFYGQNGETYGAEIYLDNRRVRWSFLDGECKEGSWYEDAGQICFVYEDEPGNPQCWKFTKGQGGLIARFENMPGATELYEAGDLGQEMICLGPRIGV